MRRNTRNRVGGVYALAMHSFLIIQWRAYEILDLGKAQIANPLQLHLEGFSVQIEERIKFLAINKAKLLLFRKR